MYSDIQTGIGHPEWYDETKFNDEKHLPKVDEKYANYILSRGLNRVVEQAKHSKENLIVEPLPEWVKKYAPPKPKKSGSGWSLSRSSLAQSLLHLHGAPFRLNRFNERGDYEDRRYLEPIYNLRHNKVLLMTGRQVEKTQTLANLIVTSSIASPYYKSIYVTPSIIQTSTFSSEKLSPLINDSPLIREYFVNAKCRHQVFDKSFANGAYIFLRSAYYSADRARGISAYLFCADEIQDQLKENLDIVSECLSHAAFPRWFYTGTPKSLDNTINGFWLKSSMTEWFIPCQRHGESKKPHTWFWQKAGMKNIGKHHLICKKCGHQIFPRFGEWRHTGKANAEWKGFRIPQIMVPWVPWTPMPDAPRSIISKLEDYDEAQFYNEVLGYAHDLAEKPLTQEDLRKCTNESLRNSEDNLALLNSRSVPIFAGIDWGTRSNKSYTIFTAGYFSGDKYVVAFMKRYEGSQSDYSYIIPDIQRMITKYNIVAIGGDQGIGFAQNDILSSAIHGYANTPFENRRFFPIFYVGNQTQYMVWDEKHLQYTLDRTRSMNDLFMAIKHQKVEFPCWEDSYEPFFQDFLNIHKEIRTSDTVGDRVLFSKHPDMTDDTTHAVNFMRQIAMRWYG